MTSSTTFVVVLCTCNGAAFIEEQLRSLSRQSRAPDYVEVHDWGSRDDTAHRVRRWVEQQQQADRYRLTTHNISPGPAESFIAASAIALENNSTATHFMFCDQDDVWHADRIQRYTQALEHSDRAIDFLFSDARLIGASGELLRSSFYAAPRSPFRYPVNLQSPDVALVNPALGFTLCLSRELLQLLVSHSSTSWPMHDWAAVILCRAYGLNSLFIPEVLADYRQHASNMRGAPSLVSARERITRLGYRMQHLKILRSWEDAQKESGVTLNPVIPNGRLDAISAVMRSRNLKLWYRLVLSSILLVSR